MSSCTPLFSLLPFLALACRAPEVTPAAVDLDHDGYAAVADGGPDCDDSNDQIFPSAIEVCNGKDDDCDGLVDEDFDVDLDGYLADAPGCLALVGVVDCDDGDAAIHPGATEACDGRDDDCNGQVDDTPDADGDGATTCMDCDDADPQRAPGLPEICDGVDNDCNGQADDPWDADGDGWAPCAGDCDDSDPAVHPEAVELCDGVDNDCNGIVDDPVDADGDGFGGCDDCDDADAQVYPGAPELCDGKDSDCDGVQPADEHDDDGDGVPICAGDCDDADPARAVGFLEICDGQDNDCDDTTDENSDNDGDGQSACGGDCDDSRATVHTGATEVCDALDDDCNGLRDETGCTGCTVEDTADHVYLFCTGSAAWDTARAQCLDWGYDLVTISDAEEEAWLDDVGASITTSAWYSGYNDIDAEGSFVWASGEGSTYTNWSSGEPNDSGGEDCMEWQWSGTRWNDCACTTALPYVCESLE